MPSTAQTLERAVQRQQSGDSAGAESLCREILRVDPAHTDALYLLGVSTARQRRFDEAIECFERLAERRPERPDVSLRLGELYRSAGRHADAAVVYTLALETHSSDPSIYNDLGVVFQELNESPAAIACFRQALVLRPGFPQAFSNLAVSLEAAGQPDDALATLQAGVKTCPSDPALACTLGVFLDHLGRTNEARNSFEKALEIAPDYAAAHFELGQWHRSRLSLDEARRHLQLAVKFDANLADAWCALGEVQVLLSQPAEESLPVCERAVELAPESPAALANLAHVLRDLNRLDEAVAFYRRSLELRPDSSSTRFMLAKSLARAGRFAEAVEEYQHVRRDDPDCPHLDYHLGIALKSLGRNDDAVTAFQSALAADPQFHKARYELGNAYRNLNRFDEAERCYNDVLQKSPEDHAALIALGNVLKTMDRQEEAAGAYRKVLRVMSDKARWELWITTLCPSVFDSNAAIDDYRYHLHRRFEAIAESGFEITPEEIATSACPAPYNLQFHGRDNRALKESYAKIFRNALPPGEPPVNTGRPKVGVVVTAGHEGVFLRYFGGVLRNMSHRNFDVEIACASSGVERIRRNLQCDAVTLRELPSRFDAALNALRNASYDVLYYWEVGSDVTNYYLPFFRLAAVQCTAGGLPDTSGLPCLDYFLSTDFVEPPAAAEFYSETLLRAETLLTCQSRLPPPDSPKTREDFGFGSRDHLYLCPHKIPKFHPDLDELLAGILRTDGRGRIVVPSDCFGYAARNLQSRMSRTLPDVVDRVKFLSHLSLDDYLSLTAAADVVLDPLHYGGGLTAYDGFSLNRPIVTLPGRFVRGRYTYGFYKLMAVEDCIAADAEDYVRIAVRLATEPDYRRDVEQRIAESSDVLFDNRGAAAEHEQIFERLIEQARKQ